MRNVGHTPNAVHQGTNKPVFEFHFLKSSWTCEQPWKTPFVFPIRAQTEWDQVETVISLDQESNSIWRDTYTSIEAARSRIVIVAKQVSVRESEPGKSLETQALLLSLMSGSSRLII